MQCKIAKSRIKENNAREFYFISRKLPQLRSCVVIYRQNCQYDKGAKESIFVDFC